MLLQDNVFAALILGLASFIAMCIYVPVILALWKLWRESKNHFNLLLLALAINDNIQLLLYAGYAAPSTFMGKVMYGYDTDTLMFGTLTNVSYFTGLAMLINIGLNRYWSICRKNTYKVTYTWRTILASVGICYAFGIASAIPQLTPCCPLRYWQDAYSFGYDMDPNAVYVWYDRTVNAVTFISGAIIYTRILLRIRQAKRTLVHICAHVSEQHRDRTNTKLAAQSALVFGLMFMGGVGFTVIPLLTNDKWWALVSSVLLICAFGIHPIIYFGFNEAIRKKTKDLFPCLKQNTVPC